MCVRNMLARLDSGEITEEQAIAEIKARYTEPLAQQAFSRILRCLLR
jgi:hypothetical protein